MMAGEEDLETLIGHIPTGRSTRPDLKCCCGRTDCGFLKHNCSALDELEKEVHTAAQLGQVSHIPRTSRCLGGNEMALDENMRNAHLFRDTPQLRNYS